MNTSHASAPAVGAQHTAGPWMLDGIQNNSAATTSIIIRAERGGNESHGRAPYVAEVSWPRDGLRRTDSAITDEDWANARLMAAAPDLLAACLAIVAQAESARDQWEADESERDTKEHGLAVCLNNRAGDLLRAAIAKSKGTT